MRISSSLAITAALVGLAGVACSSSTHVTNSPVEAGPAGGAGGSGGGGGAAGAANCTKDTDCPSAQWCNTTAGSCAPLVMDGKACGADNQCANAHCVGGLCCHTACDSPMTCTGGTCSCNGAACASGVTCVVWHLDEDGDGHAGTLADVVGCGDQMPTPPAQYAGHTYDQSADDCDDANADAFPGQTKYFTTARADGSFDYNCDNKVEKEYPTVNVLTVCKKCFYFPSSDGGVSCTSPCLLGGRTYGYTCTGTGPCSQAASFQGISSSVGCGKSGTLRTCNACTSGETTTTVTLGCR